MGWRTLGLHAGHCSVLGSGNAGDVVFAESPAALDPSSSSSSTNDPGTVFCQVDADGGGAVVSRENQFLVKPPTVPPHDAACLSGMYQFYSNSLLSSHPAYSQNLHVDTGRKLGVPLGGLVLRSVDTVVDEPRRSPAPGRLGRLLDLLKWELVTSLGMVIQISVLNPVPCPVSSLARCHPNSLFSRRRRRLI